MTYSRRTVLKTIGLGCLAGCGGGDGDGAPEGVATMCGADLCVSIAENPELASVGGGLVFKAPGHTIYVVKTSATAFSVVTAVCTHANCTIEWDGTTRFVCPCHGSTFSPDGVATKGPAFRPLRSYPHTLQGDTLTISLA